MATVPELLNIAPPLDPPELPPPPPPLQPSPVVQPPQPLSPPDSPLPEGHAVNGDEQAVQLTAMADTFTQVGTGLEGLAVDCRRIGTSFSAAAAHPAIGHLSILGELRHLRNTMRQQFHAFDVAARDRFEGLRGEIHELRVDVHGLRVEGLRAQHRASDDNRRLRNLLVIDHRNTNARVSNSLAQLSDPLVPLLSVTGEDIDGFPPTGEAIVNMSGPELAQVLQALGAQQIPVRLPARRALLRALIGARP